MKKIKELHVKYDINMVLKRMFLSLSDIIKRIIKIIIYMPFYMLYFNAFMFMLGKIGNMSNDDILKSLIQINTIDGFVNMFIYVIIIFIVRWEIRGILGIFNNDRKYSTLGKKVGSLQDISNNFDENMSTKQNAKFTLYENGVIKESRFLEDIPNGTFEISNVELDKIYMLVKEDIGNE